MIGRIVEAILKMALFPIGLFILRQSMISKIKALISLVTVITSLIVAVDQLRKALSTLKSGSRPKSDQDQEAKL
jgi:hypothetical protein